jgi:hypothetical protein
MHLVKDPCCLDIEGFEWTLSTAIELTNEWSADYYDLD